MKRELLQRNVLQHQQFLGYAKLLEPIYSCRSFYQRHLLLFAASFDKERELQCFVALKEIMTKCCRSL